MASERESLFQRLEPWLQRIESAARKGGEDSGWLASFRSEIRDLAAENNRLKDALNRERKYRESQEGLPEGTLPRV